MAPPLTNKEFRCAFNAASYFLAVARHQGYALSLKTLKQQSYRNIPENKNARVYFSCVQGGVSTKEQSIKNPRSTDKNERSRQTSSIKIGCKFQVAIKFSSRRNRWSVDSENSHNHELIPIPEHLAKYRHLSNDAKKLVNSLTSASVPTRHIRTIVASSSINQPTLKDISNASAAFRRQHIAGRSMMATLLEDLKNDDWMVRTKTSPAGELESLFLSSAESIRLGLRFATVFGLDCTYKTNRFNLPLLHIIGTTCNNQSFSLAFCLMRDEKESTYIWALEQL